MLTKLKNTSIIFMAFALTACGAADKLKNVGKEPPLTAIESPTEKIGYRKVQMPISQEKARPVHNASLWTKGSGSLFGDNRASQIGDIVTIEINISDKANINNTTSRNRTSSEDFGVDALGGALKALTSGSENINQANLVGFGNNSKSTGNGSVNRKEDLELKVAAVIIQKLPNGNFVVEGKQEVRVNFEVRELFITGIVRPEDIRGNNTIDSSRIAEARISYGGRGHISDVQQPRYGQQVLDVILPF